MVDQATWRDFVEGLRTRNDYCRVHEIQNRHGIKWNVLGEKGHSYLHTISTGRGVTRLRDWSNLTQRECYILRGHDQNEGTWGLLGSFGREANSVFTPQNMPDVGPVRVQIRQFMEPVLNAPSNQIAQVAHDAAQNIMAARDRFGPAAATRLLALARPDCLVSVNGPSAPGLGALADLPQRAHGLANNYAALLGWVYRQPWFNAPEPDDPFERQIWNSRAALLDAFVYPSLNPGDG